MKLDEIVTGFSVVFVISLCAAAIWGWIANVLAIAGTVDAPLTGLFILRCIGVLVAPLGAILGFV